MVTGVVVTEELATGVGPVNAIGPGFGSAAAGGAPASRPAIRKATAEPTMGDMFGYPDGRRRRSIPQKRPLPHCIRCGKMRLRVGDRAGYSAEHDLDAVRGPVVGELDCL